MRRLLGRSIVMHAHARKVVPVPLPELGAHLMVQQLPRLVEHVGDSLCGRLLQLWCTRL